MTKSSAALHLSIDGMRTKKLRLWTFTFSDVHSVADGAALWSRASKALTRLVGFRGVRVFELHPGGHGLHIHVLTDRFYKVGRVSSLARLEGFGRVHVCVCPYERRHYIAKYLRKETRAVSLKGRRLWAAFGGFKGVKVSSMVSDSAFAKWYRLLSASGYGLAVNDELPRANRRSVLLRGAALCVWNELVYGSADAAVRVGLAVGQSVLDLGPSCEVPCGGYVRNAAIWG